MVAKKAALRDIQKVHQRVVERVGLRAARSVAQKVAPMAATMVVSRAERSDAVRVGRKGAAKAHVMASRWAAKTGDRSAE